MLISIHPTRGKSLDKDVVQAMGDGWDNIDVDWAEAFELITRDGYATSAELAHGRRIGSDYASRQLFMVDVDNDTTKQPATLSLAELQEHAFYSEFGAGYYATHSYKPTHERFRICFVLESPITDHSRARQFIRGLLSLFPAGDPACKDPVRLFYGSPNCAVKQFRQQLVPDSIVEELIAVVAAEDLKKATPDAPERSYTPPSSNDIGEILDELKHQYFDLPYESRRDVVWAVLSAVSAPEAIQMLRSRWPDNNKTYKYEDYVRDHAKPYSGKRLGVGSLFAFIRKSNPKWTLKKYKNIFTERTLDVR